MGYKRLFKGSPSSYFLFGPRGTGKSTWVQEHCPHSIWIDLLDPAEVRLLSAKPERLRERVEANPSKKRVVIDEVKRVPEVLTVVHQLIEKKKGLQFILTGSSARKLKRTGVDLLAGRALIQKIQMALSLPIRPPICKKRFRRKGSSAISGTLPVSLRRLVFPMPLF